MKKLIFTFMASALLASNAISAEQNPLLQKFSGIHEVPPFDKITNEHYIPAFTEAIKQARADVDAVINNPAEPTFENTIVALEFGGKLLNNVASIFFNLNQSNTNDEMQKIALEVSAPLTEFENDISLNPGLFKRVKTLYDKRESLGLNKEQMRLLVDKYKGFTRSGAALSDADKEIYRTLTKELSELSLKFNQNLLAATNDFTLHITDKKQLEGLPDFVVEGAASEAKDRNLEGWVITLQAPSMIPFMTYSPNRELKEKLWRANNTRAFGGKFDNTDNVKRITELRLKLANLLGYKTYADYALEDRMAESADNVNAFLAQLLGRAVDGARKDVKEISEYAKSKGADFELMPWDFGYYSEKYKDEKYSINDEMTKPYFSLENAQKGIFALANKLYGITFKENSSIPAYHKDVKTYEVFDKDGSFLAVFYADFFPRESKRGGAWMTEFRGQSIKNGVNERPLISIVCNFTKPTPEMPSLLTFDEVTTFLHEFGHALHGMFANSTYPSQSGTSVYRDFVELPSQIMENWGTEKEFLDMWAVHYKTGEKIPAEMVKKIVDSKNYLAAYSHIRQVSFGLSDMAWHSITAPITGNINDFEKEAIKETQILPYVDGQCMATAFGHIFAGGYSAGYYSYKWAEVLEADAFSMFQEKGIFNQEVATSFRENILSKGDTEHPMELYIRYRGHKPDANALFKKMGL